MTMEIPSEIYLPKPFEYNLHKFRVVFFIQPIVAKHLSRSNNYHHPATFSLTYRTCQNLEGNKLANALAKVILV